jgi:hypothetical protein
MGPKKLMPEKIYEIQKPKSTTEGHGFIRLVVLRSDPDGHVPEGYFGREGLAFGEELCSRAGLRRNVPTCVSIRTLRELYLLA